MSEDLIVKLGSFTPAALDRDAILFAAGRASAAPSRGWKRLAAALAASQAVTLALWFAPTTQPRPDPAPLAPIALPMPVSDDVPELSAPDPYSLLALRRDPEPRSVATDSPMPARPPLMAFSRNYQP